MPVPGPLPSEQRGVRGSARPTMGELPFVAPCSFLCGGIEPKKGPLSLPRPPGNWKVQGYFRGCEPRIRTTNPNPTTVPSTKCALDQLDASRALGPFWKSRCNSMQEQGSLDMRQTRRMGSTRTCCFCLGKVYEGTPDGRPHVFVCGIHPDNPENERNLP